MPNVGGQKYKILVLYNILVEKTDEEHPMNATQLVEELKKRGIPAERKSIYKDVATLQDAEVDVVKNADGYYIGQRLFQLPELKLLVDAISASKFISEHKSKELTEKICALASENESKQLIRQVIVPDRAKTDNEKIFYTIDVVYKCLDENKQMAFQYEEWTIEKKKSLRKNGAIYKVSPAFLIRNDENYYLVAYDEASKSIRHYRVDKIVNARVMDVLRGGIEARKALTPEEYAKNNVGMYAGKEQTVTIKCQEKLIGALIDKFGTDITIRNDENGFIKARIPVAVSAQFYGWLVGIGAKITAPKEEAESFKKYLLDITAI